MAIGYTTKQHNSYHTNSVVTLALRQAMVEKIEESIQEAGVELFGTSSELENYMYCEASDKPEYLSFIDVILTFIQEIAEIEAEVKKSSPYNL